MAENQNFNDDIARSISSSIYSSLVEIAFYPLNYIKALTQIGHEPLPPFKSKTLFGREQLFYPNSFQCCAYVYSVEGLSGLYRGFGMRLISRSVEYFVSSKAARMIQDNEEKKDTKNELQLLAKSTTNRIHSRCWGILISHPFYVMMVRCMAQFVGGETKYSSWNIFQNTFEIYHSEGVKGFFSGLVPRLLLEVLNTALYSVVIYLFKNYFIGAKEKYAAFGWMASFTDRATFPLLITSNVSCVSGSTLIAGQPPRMLTHSSWIDVLKHLYETNQLYRGFSAVNRICAPSDLQRVETFAVNTTYLPYSYFYFSILILIELTRVSF